MSIARQENRESFNIKQGDVVRIKAGTSAYLVNQDNKQRLVLAKLLVPINTPGEFQVILYCLLCLVITPFPRIG